MSLGLGHGTPTLGCYEDAPSVLELSGFSSNFGEQPAFKIIGQIFEECHGDDGLETH